MNFLVELLLFFKSLFNPFEFKEYLDKLNKNLEKEQKRRTYAMYTYNQSLRKLSKYRMIPEYVYKRIDNSTSWHISNTEYGYNAKKTKKRRKKNKIKHI